MDNIDMKDIAKGLNEISWDILEILENKQNVNYTELKKLLKISHEKSYIEIARLEGAALIEKCISPRDRRVLEFKITKYGNQILKFK